MELVAPGPTDRILEVDSGPGVSAGLICARLTTGQLLSVDRSPIAIERSRKRNREHLESGRLVLRQCRLADLDEPPDSVDSALSINVNLFWADDPTAELEILNGALRPGGWLHILYGAAGPTASRRVVEPIASAMRACGFVDITVVATEHLDGVDRPMTRHRWVPAGLIATVLLPSRRTGTAKGRGGQRLAGGRDGDLPDVFGRRAT
ncbi:MAG: class I SAM-dependent methyltransferase [Candidatus Limnocylindrales bacterium]